MKWFKWWMIPIWVFALLVGTALGAGLAISKAEESYEIKEGGLSVPAESQSEKEGESAPIEPMNEVDTVPEESEVDSMAPEASSALELNQLATEAVRAKLHLSSAEISDSEANQVAGVQTENGDQLCIFAFQAGEDGTNLIVETECEVSVVWWKDFSGNWQSADVSERVDEQDDSAVNFLFAIPEEILVDGTDIWIDCDGGSDP